jgi:Fe-S cluster assembly ATP-binding protein
VQIAAPRYAEAVPALLEVEDLWVRAAGRDILRGVSLRVGEGELHALMGPNGSGKSTLAHVLMGSPAYEVVSGTIRFRGEDVTAWSPDARAKAGMFLAFQHPEAIPGVPVAQFLRQAISARRGVDVSVLEVRLELQDWLERLGMDPSFASRPLNEGFSGGERKRNEILQLALLAPDFAVLDETDSGLDIDALGVVARGLAAVREQHPSMGLLVVTHYTAILGRLEPDAVHVLLDGRIVAEGGPALARELETSGYESLKTAS